MTRAALFLLTATLFPITANGAPSCQGLDTTHLVRDIDKLPPSIKVSLQRQFPRIRPSSTDFCFLGDVGPNTCFMAAAPYGKQWAVAYGVGGFGTKQGLVMYRADTNSAWHQTEAHNTPPCVLGALWELAYQKGKP